MEGWARDMHRKGAAERPQVICMRIFTRKSFIEGYIHREHA